MIKKIKPNYREFIQKFWVLAKKHKMKDFHLMFELCSLVCGIQKAFDMHKPHNDFVKLINEFSQSNASVFLTAKLENTIFLFRREHMSIFDEYLSLEISGFKKDRARLCELYGELMAFPKTATEAWRKDDGRYDNNRKHLLNFYSSTIMEGIFKPFGLMNFIHSKKNWQKEFLYQIKTELTVIQTFPEIFTFSKTSKFKLCLEMHAFLRKQKDLFKLMSPLQKALFLGCQDARISFKEKNSLYRAACLYNA